jgi:chromosomal replication initiation ATPase DnaA
LTKSPVRDEFLKKLAWTASECCKEASAVGEARNVAMWMIWESGTKSLREIGELFGGLDYAAVAQRIRRTRLAYDAKTKNKLL